MDDNFTTAFLTIEVFGNFNEQLVLKEVKIKKKSCKGDISIIPSLSRLFKKIEKAKENQDLLH